MTAKKSVAPAAGRREAKSHLAKEKILQAIVCLIKEGGFANATVSKIAARSGLSWGAVQHHFGDKEKVVVAVTDLSHQKLRQRMEDSKLRQGTLADRSSLFVDRMWEHYQDDVLLSALEILLASRGFHALAPEHWEDRYRKEHLATMREVFGAAGLTDARLLELLDYIHCQLTGMTIKRVFQRSQRFSAHHLNRLKSTLLSTLQGSPADQPGKLPRQSWIKAGAAPAKLRETARPRSSRVQ